MNKISRILLPLLFFCLLGGTVVLTVALLSPPRPLPVDAPAKEFSAGRAMQDLEVIAREPHPMGPSPAHAAVRDYLLAQIRALGLEPQVQNTFGVRVIRPGWIVGGFVENILVRLPGTDPQGAIMLISHYDTTPANPGAGCSTTGVVTVLEILRTLQASSPLRHDVMFLLTDGEEPGTIGSHAFVAQHPWFAEVKLVINMDQYVDGPPVLLDANPGTGPWGQALAEGASSTRPVYISFPFDLFPIGDSDFLPFDLAGVSGAAISTIISYPENHTMLDLPYVVNPGGLQQAGNQILALVRYLGVQPTLELDASAQTFFPVLGRLIHYPASWAIPLAVAAGLCFLGTLFFGLWRKMLTWKGMGLSCLIFVVGLGASILLIVLLWWGILSLHPEYGYSAGARSHLYGDQTYVIGFLFLLLAILTGSFAVLRRKVSALDLAAGTLLIWFPATIAVTILLPATSYLVTWVLLFSSLALLLALIVQPRKKGWYVSGLGFLVAAILSIFLWIPLLYINIVSGSSLGSGLMLLALFVTSTGLWLSSLIPLLDWIASPKRWLLPLIALLAGLGFIIAGNLIVGKESPPAWVNSIGYWMDADDGQASWIAFIGGTRMDTHATTSYEASFPKEMDARQLRLMADPVRRPYTDLFPEAPSFSVLTSEAPRLTTDGPRLELFDDQRVAERRIVTAQITTSSFARLYIVLPKGSPLLTITVPHNKRIELPPVEDGWVLRFDGMYPEGVKVSFEFSGPDAIQILLVEEKTGLPSFPGLSLQPEPGTMQGPGEFYQGIPTDFSAIYRSFIIPGLSKRE